MGASNQDRQTAAMERLAAAVERFVDLNSNPNAHHIADEHLDDWHLMTRAEQSRYDYDPRNYAVEREAADEAAARARVAQEKAEHDAAEARSKAEHDAAEAQAETERQQREHEEAERLRQTVEEPVVMAEVPHDEEPHQE
jgi:hypothetical protein